MSTSETTNSSESSDSDNEVSNCKALPCPDVSVELASTLKADGKAMPEKNDEPSTAVVSNETRAAQDMFPWQPTRDSPKEINILLLGESGVGKSTFINSFANYMKHENFQAVLKSELRVLIPARFNIFDKDLQKHSIEIGVNDDNEILSDGAAATQNVKAYVFYVTLENTPYMIRLIDTPGMGDPRGIDQDNTNCDHVLNYLGQLEKVHAICLLLQPATTRLNVFLNYCVTQILSRLEKSAVNNIAFLFTNTRGQNYTPGETYTSLEVLVKKIKDSNNVCLPLSKHNVFCFDNEAFRFLASIKQGVKFKEGILEANIESWKYSYKEIYRVLSYIVELKPHDPKKTIGVNHARKMVLQLAQPLAEIVQLIGDNIYELDQHTNQLLMENQTLSQLKQKLYMPVIDIRVKELPQPVTVCTAANCSTTYKVAGKNKYHYKQRCHNPCYLNNVPAEIVGDPKILHCWAMNKSTQICHQCNCRFNTHMHIYYETETFDNKIVDENVQQNINSKEEATKEKERMINTILNKKEELEKEHKYIIKCSAAFAHFLQQNAITPINDSLKEYINYLISREENLGPHANRATLDYLRRLLLEYEQEKNVLEEALRHDSATNAAPFDNSPVAIEQKIHDLFTLQHFGKQIRKLYNLHQSGAVTEHKQSEFVIKELYQLTVGKIKGIGNSVMGALGWDSSKKRKEKKKKTIEIDIEQYNRMMSQMALNLQGHPDFHWNDDNFPRGSHPAGFLPGYHGSEEYNNYRLTQRQMSTNQYQIQGPESFRNRQDSDVAMTTGINRKGRNEKIEKNSGKKAIQFTDNCSASESVGVVEEQKPPANKADCPSNKGKKNKKSKRKNQK